MPARAGQAARALRFVFLPHCHISDSPPLRPTKGGGEQLL